jgi:hypothetical protein
MELGSSEPATETNCEPDESSPHFFTLFPSDKVVPVLN